MYLLLVLPIIGLLVIALWFQRAREEERTAEERVTLPAALLSLWIVSSAVFGGEFYVFRVAGIFDITIERLIFIVMIALFIVGLFTGKVRPRGPFTIEILMGAFLLFCVISMVRTGFLPTYPQFPSPWFVFITGYLFPFVVFLFAKHFLFRERDMSLVLHTLFFFGIYLSVTGYFEFFNLPQFVFPRYIMDPQVSTLHLLERARGPFLNAGFNGFAILVGLISGLHLLQKKSGPARVFHIAGLALFFPAVFFVQTRMIYLGLIITLIIFLRWYKAAGNRWKLISLPLSLVLIAGIILSPRLLSTERREGGVYQVQEVEIRMALLQRSYLLFAEYPFTGIGLAQFIPGSLRLYKGPARFDVEEAGTQFQHNHLLGIATELGIPGLLLYVSFVVLVLRRLRQIAGKLPETGIMGGNLRIVMATVWTVYLTINLFLEPSSSLYANAIPLLFAGVADGVHVRSLQAKDVPVRPVSMGLSSPTSQVRMVGGHV